MSVAPLKPLRLELVGHSTGGFPSQEEMNRKTIELLERDNRRCGYCGHFSPLLRGLEVDHEDGDHSNWDIKNLGLACHWCHATRHLEFSLRAGAVLVHVDYPQTGISRLTTQCAQASHLALIYDKIAQKGVDRREHNFPNGALGSVDYLLRRQINRGDVAGAQKQLEKLNADSIRIMFPSSYINPADTPPPDIKEEAWSAITGFMIRQRTTTLRDNDRRALLADTRKELISNR